MPPVDGEVVVEPLLGVDGVLPAPMLPAAPVLPGVEDVVPPEEAPLVLLPALPALPEELLPLVTLLSCRHLSRSAPIMPRHLLELLLLAPPEAESLLDDPALEEPALGDEVDGDDEVDGEALGDELDAPVELLGVDELPAEPVALLLVSAPLAPDDDAPAAELCAMAALERASSAAAVAEQISFNVIELPPSQIRG